MNKTIPFGYHSLGNHTLIKINMNLAPEDAIEIRKEYNFLVSANSRKNPNLYRVEGVLHYANHEAYTLFYNKLPIYKENAKIYIAACKKAMLLDQSIGMGDFLAPADLDLPF